MRIALTFLGLDLLTLEVTTDAEGDDPGDSMTSPVEVGFRLVEREGGSPELVQ